VAQPSYHLAPIELEAPPGANGAEAGAPAVVELPGDLAGIDTARLTPQRIDALRRHAFADVPVRPQAAPIVVYSPAQIRAAYHLPPLPAAGTDPTVPEAAAQGAGQTIYIVDAHHHAAVAADLATFDAAFGLPGCAVEWISAATRLPLAPASAASGCTLAVAFSSVQGTLTDTPPSTDDAWSVEIDMDVQWAHATAPLARIVLIETASPATADLAAAALLAGAMGPGVVSMSFNAPEGSYMAPLDAAFSSQPLMSYVASAGDAGSGANWPAVSPDVLAVGGTTLSLARDGVRSERAWSRTGGGVSGYVAEPAYQASVARPISIVATAGRQRGMRSVADVSFNADPASGQYVAVTPAGADSAGWYSAGGTSLGAPQWAALLAIANAQRGLAGRAPLGLAQTLLYRDVAAVPGRYAAGFLDVTRGSDGACASCSAGPGYDAPTGLGTPNATALLGMLVAY
jgi:subtilase family serine protease